MPGLTKPQNTMATMTIAIEGANRRSTIVTTPAAIETINRGTFK